MSSETVRQHWTWAVKPSDSTGHEQWNRQTALDMSSETVRQHWSSAVKPSDSTGHEQWTMKRSDSTGHQQSWETWRHCPWDAIFTVLVLVLLSWCHHWKSDALSDAKVSTTAAQSNNSRYLADVVEPPVITHSTDHVQSTQRFSCTGPHLLLQMTDRTPRQYIMIWYIRLIIIRCQFAAIHRTQYI